MELLAIFKPQTSKYSTLLNALLLFLCSNAYRFAIKSISNLALNSYKSA